MVEIGAREIKSIGEDVSDQGGTLLTTWQRLAQHYEAPEAGTLFGVMDPVKTNAETFGVSSALTTYAAEVEPIKAELAKIKTEAQDFVVSIPGGVEKKSYSRAGVHTSTVEWHEDQDTVDANNALIGRVNAQMVLLWAAERRCANAIYDIIGFPHIEAATESNPNGYGVSEIPEGQPGWSELIADIRQSFDRIVGWEPFVNQLGELERRSSDAVVEDLGTELYREVDHPLSSATSGRYLQLARGLAAIGQLDLSDELDQANPFTPVAEAGPELAALQQRVDEVIIDLVRHEVDGRFPG